MPSSFTPLLKLELPATGELSGTWGTTVNNAITTPLSEAVAGTTTITVGGSDYTLSNGDGSAANEARKMFIVATGTPGASRNVICPAASKFYVFRNDTNQTLTLKTLSGTGIAVPAGQYRFLYCDGTNVVETFNAMASLTLGTALAAASGGTGQSSYTAGDLLYATGTTALSKLGIGAANRVLTSSGSAPQWVTSLTGLTGVSSSSITNTSLTATRLVYSTTGGAQTDSANLTFDGTSLTINGSPNLILSSSGIERGRIVTGTGAVELMAGSTTTPTISMASNVATFTNNPVLSGGTANGVLYLDGSKVATSGSALTFDGSKLGVGGNPASTGLDTGVTQAFIVAPNSNTGAAATFIADSVGRGVLVADQAKTTIASISVSSGVVGFGANSNTPVIFNVNAAEQMRLTNTGLGIGTTPSYKLDVQTSAGRFQVQDFGAGSILLYSNGALAYNAATTGHRWQLNGSEQMRLDSSGNLGLGVTPSAWFSGYTALQIPAGSFSGFQTATLIIQQNSFFSAATSDNRYVNNGFAGQYTMVSGQHRWLTAPSGTAGNAISFTQAMTLDASGNLGVGTTSPSQRLDVRGSVYVQRDSNPTNALAVQLTNQTTVSNNGCRLSFDAFNIGSSALGVPSDSAALAFYTGGVTTERARIPAAGGMVVGTAALATTATDGFLYVPTCAGTPTGTPTTQTGTAPIVVDTTNNKLYFYSGGQWRDAGP